MCNGRLDPERETIAKGWCLSRCSSTLLCRALAFDTPGNAGRITSQCEVYTSPPTARLINKAILAKTSTNQACTSNRIRGIVHRKHVYSENLGPSKSRFREELSKQIVLELVRVSNLSLQRFALPDNVNQWQFDGEKEMECTKLETM